MNKLMTTVLFSGFLGLSTMSASADILSSLQSMGLQDVRQAEAIYAANPQVPTYKAATQCLEWADSVLSAPGAAPNLGVTLEAPMGAVSAVADLDVLLSTNSGGLPPVVDQFNQNCGWYIEDLKAAAAAHAGKAGLSIFGLHL